MYKTKLTFGGYFREISTGNICMEDFDVIFVATK